MRKRPQQKHENKKKQNPSRGKESFQKKRAEKKGEKPERGKGGGALGF